MTIKVRKMCRILEKGDGKQNTVQKTRINPVPIHKRNRRTWNIGVIADLVKPYQIK